MIFPTTNSRCRGDQTRWLQALSAVLAAVFTLATSGPGTAADSAVAPADSADAVIGGVPVGAPRVIGGSLSSAGQWPSVVALVRAGSGSPADRQFCGATVVGPRWILTAAHCLYDALGRPVEASDIRVVSGVIDLRAERGRESVVTNLFHHPGYDHTAEDAYDDIALIELANALVIPATPLFAGDPEALGQAPSAVVGWGATEFTTPSRATYPDAQHHANVPLVPRATCNRPESYAGYVGGGQLCAGFAEGGVDTCVGDSGGPLFVEVDGRVEQAGVVSYGRGCAEPLFYGIYTSVSAYRSWIGDYVELPEASVPAGVESPRGPATNDAPSLPADAPVARPVNDDGAPDGGDTLEGAEEPSEGVLLPSGGGGGFGGATGWPWLLTSIGALGIRRRGRRAPSGISPAAP